MRTRQPEKGYVKVELLEFGLKAHDSNSALLLAQLPKQRQEEIDTMRERLMKDGYFALSNPYETAQKWEAEKMGHNRYVISVTVPFVTDWPDFDDLRKETHNGVIWIGDKSTPAEEEERMTGPYPAMASASVPSRAVLNLDSLETLKLMRAKVFQLNHSYLEERPLVKEALGMESKEVGRGKR